MWINLLVQFVTQALCDRFVLSLPKPRSFVIKEVFKAVCGPPWGGAPNCFRGDSVNELFPILGYCIKWPESCVIWLKRYSSFGEFDCFSHFPSRSDLFLSTRCSRLCPTAISAQLLRVYGIKLHNHDPIGIQELEGN